MSRDTAPMKPVGLPNCTGVCGEGRMMCPTPYSCEIPEDDDDEYDTRTELDAVMQLVAMWVLCLAAFGIAMWLAVISGLTF